MTYGIDNSPTDFSPIDVGQSAIGNELDVTTKLNKITKARNKEEQWRKRAKRIVRIYRDDSETEGTTYTSNRPFSYSESPFNILWANIQTLSPALYSAMPKPDVRNRFLNNDPNAQIAGSILEKVLTYILDQGNFDEQFRSVLFDYLGPGRGVGRIRLIPEIDRREIEEQNPNGEVQVNVEEKLVAQQCKYERVPFERWIVDPVDCWSNVMWMAFEHQLTEDEFGEFFPDQKNKVAVVTHSENKFEIEPRYEVYEIWDKKERKVYYIGSSPKLLKVQDDPFGFENFWPIMEPLVSIKTGDTMVPVPEFTIYEPQAYELNQVTYRITDLVKACKFHGIYDSSQNNMEDLLQSSDSTFVPDNGDNMKKNGIKNIMDFVDTSPVAKVLQVLYQQRDEIKRIIDDITGISDILRGEGDPKETATAQRIKASYAGLRLRDRKESINKYIVGCLRMMTELIAKHYPTEQLEAISGEKITPEIENIIRDDILRNYKVDIETDSTVLADYEAESAKRVEVLRGMGEFMQTFTPFVQSGILTLETAKEFLKYGLGASKLPRSMTDAIDKIGMEQQMQHPSIEGERMVQEMPPDQMEPDTDMMLPPELQNGMGQTQVRDQMQSLNL